jgi:hypothetical protein
MPHAAALVDEIANELDSWPGVRIERRDDRAAPDSDVVRHDVEGPSDVTAVLELFDSRYRDLRGEDDPYSSQDQP